MNGPVWLIAGREIRTYVSTASFWIALVIGPLFMAGALALASASPPSAVPVQVVADDPAQAAALVQAVGEAAAADGQKLVISQGPAKIHVRLAALGPGRSELRIDAAAPFSPAARMLVLKTFEAIQARALGLTIAGFSCLTNFAAGLSASPLSHAEVLETGKSAAADFARLLSAALPRI